MKNKPLDFQAATAEHVLDAYKKGQKRVLVADEAGLGKTTVASEVLRRVKEELSKDVNFTLSAFSYKTKYVKSKGDIVDEYQVVTAKKVFNDEKDPVSFINVRYEV